MKTKPFFFSLLAACLIGTFAQAQSNNGELLSKHVWTITEDMMSGLGTHHSLPSGAQLTFKPDGSWQATQPIFNATSGSWQLKGADNLLLIFGGENKKSKAKILKINDKELLFKVKRRSAAYTFSWTSQA